MQTTTPGNDQSLHTLNSFLRGELSAAETYRQALGKVTEPTLRIQLESCLRSHENRIRILNERVRALGGEPAKNSGAWGAFARLLEGAAKLFGDKAAISALEEGEDHGRDDYRRDIDKVDAESRSILERDVIPEQERTHRALSTLKHTVH